MALCRAQETWNWEDGSLSPAPSPSGPFSQAVLMFPLSFLLPSVIDKFDYVFAENGTVQYKNGQLVSKQVSPAPLAATALLPCALLLGRRADCSPQMPGLNGPLLQIMFLGGLPGKSSIFLTPLSPPLGHSGPLGRRAAAGPHQLLSQLHGTAEAAQETVMSRAHEKGSHQFLGSFGLQSSPENS